MNVYTPGVYLLTPVILYKTHFEITVTFGGHGVTKINIFLIFNTRHPHMIFLDVKNCSLSIESKKNVNNLVLVWNFTGFMLRNRPFLLLLRDKNICPLELWPPCRSQYASDPQFCKSFYILIYITNNWYC